MVDATQGVEAQTLANPISRSSKTSHHPGDQQDRPAQRRRGEVAARIEDVIACPRGAILASAKEGTGIEDILEAVVTRVPPPTGERKGALSALIFDSMYDIYRGVMIYVRVIDGAIKSATHRDEAHGHERSRRLASSDPRWTSPEANAGEVGYMATDIKDVADCQRGRHRHGRPSPADEALPGLQVRQPWCSAGIYPVSSDDYPQLREALDKPDAQRRGADLRPETSLALAFGFRCGFLGLSTWRSSRSGWSASTS